MPVRIPDPGKIPDNKCCSKPLHLEVICYTVSLPQQAQANQCTVFLSQRLVTTSQPCGSRRGAPRVLEPALVCLRTMSSEDAVRASGSKGVPRSLWVPPENLFSPSLTSTYNHNTICLETLKPFILMAYAYCSYQRRAPGHVTSYVLTPSQLFPW